MELVIQQARAMSDGHRKSMGHTSKEHTNHVQVIHSFGKTPEITFLSDSAHLQAAQIHDNFPGGPFSWFRRFFDFSACASHPPLFLDNHPTKSHDSCTRSLPLVTSITESINIDDVLWWLWSTRTSVFSCFCGDVVTVMAMVHPWGTPYQLISGI